MNIHTYTFTHITEKIGQHLWVQSFFFKFKGCLMTFLAKAQLNLYEYNCTSNSSEYTQFP